MKREYMAPEAEIEKFTVADNLILTISGLIPGDTEEEVTGEW